MYEVTIRSRFSAAHRLLNYGGKCEALHGHNWIVEVTVQGSRLDDTGLLLDFKVLKRWVAEVLDELDHTLLNDHQAFREENPSSERIARFVHEAIGRKVTDPGISIAWVRVWESDDSAATFRD